MDTFGENVLTEREKMFIKEFAKHIKIVDCNSRTYLPRNTCSFKFILERFSESILITSKEFYTDIGTSWKFSIRNSVDSIKFFLMREKCQGQVKVKYELYFVGSSGEVLIHTTSTTCYNDSTKNYEKIIEATIKEDDLKKSNDTVELTLILEFPNTEVTVQYDPLQYNFPSENEFQQDVRESLLGDLLKFYECQNTYVTLSIDGETLEVHQAILSARSPVFAKMFKQKSADFKDVVDIRFVNMATMKEVVAFMYGRARRDYNFETALKVYYAANTYDVKKLKDICRDILTFQLNEENAGELLCVADGLEDCMLKKTVVNFILSNWKSCISTKWWNAWLETGCRHSSELLHIYESLRNGRKLPI